MPDGNQPDGINRADLAAAYGFALSVLRSDKGLWRVFNAAVKNTWTPERFVAEIRDTHWFKTNSESARAALILRKTDPATWQQRMNQTQAQITDLASQMGSNLSPAHAARLASNVLTFGWNDNQIQNVLAQSIKLQGGHYAGQAEQNAENLRQLALDNGVHIGKDQLQNWLQKMGAGESGDTYKAYIQQQAISAFPAWANEIQAGHSVKEMASGYINSMANILEINPNEVDLFDPTLRKALQAQNQDGKLVQKPIWQFETELRKDPRWLKTNNARDSLMGAAHGVLSEWGLV